MMMEKNFCLFLCCIVAGIFGAELPDYIQRCSMSDPKFYQCIKDNANLAIPEVVKGFPSFGIPVLAPLHLPTFQLDGKDVKLKLKDFYLSGFENLRLTRAVLSLKDKKAVFEMAAPYFNITSDYMVVDDDAFTPSNYGGGKLRLSLADNVLKAVCTLVTPVKDGEVYVIIDTLVMNLRTRRTQYKFDNIYIMPGGDTKEFVKKHTRIMEGQLQPAIAKFIANTVRATATGFSSNVPVKDIFLE